MLFREPCMVCFCCVPFRCLVFWKPTCPNLIKTKYQSHVWRGKKKTSNPKLPTMGDDPIRLCSNILRIGDHPPQVMGASVLEKQWMLTRDPGPSENPEAILVVLEILPLAMKKIRQKVKKGSKKVLDPFFLWQRNTTKHMDSCFFFHFLPIHF